MFVFTSLNHPEAIRATFFVAVERDLVLTAVNRQILQLYYNTKMAPPFEEEDNPVSIKVVGSLILGYLVVHFS